MLLESSSVPLITVLCIRTRPKREDPGDTSGGRSSDGCTLPSQSAPRQPPAYLTQSFDFWRSPETHARIRPPLGGFLPPVQRRRDPDQTRIPRSAQALAARGRTGELQPLCWLGPHCDVCSFIWSGPGGPPFSHFLPLLPVFLCPPLFSLLLRRRQHLVIPPLPYLHPNYLPRRRRPPKLNSQSSAGGPHTPSTDLNTNWIPQPPRPPTSSLHTQIK